MEVVRSFVQILDADLAAALPQLAALQHRRPSSAVAGAGAAAAAPVGAAVATHTGYLPSIDDMLLQGEVPAPEHPQPQVS